MSATRKTRIPTRTQLNGRAATELEGLLPGVGTVFAGRIVEHRALHGPFESASDLARVKGLGGRRAERLWSKLALRSDGLPTDVPAMSDPSPVPPSDSTVPDDGSPAPDPHPSAPPVVTFEPAEAHSVMTESLEPAAHTPTFEDLPRAPQPEEDLPAPPARRSLFPVALGGLLAAALGVAGTLGVVHALERTPPASATDVAAVSRDVAALREDLAALRAAQTGDEDERRAFAERIDDLDARSSADAAALAAIDERDGAQEARAARAERELAARLGKVDDELLWHRLVWAAQHAEWRAKRAAAEAEANAGDDGAAEE